MTKGQQVFVEGRLQARQFEAREGGTKALTEVIVTSLRVLGGAKNSNHTDSNPDHAAADTTDAETEAVPF